MLLPRLALKALPFWRRWASFKPDSKQASAVAADQRQLRGHFDVLGHPILIFASPDGRETALDYSSAPPYPEVPIDWVRAFGHEIDNPRWLGVILARRCKRPAPVVLMHADGKRGLIITPKTAVSHTRWRGEWHVWRTGVHFTPAEIRTFKRLDGDKATAIIAGAQSPAAGMKHAEFGDHMVKMAIENLNYHVMERHGGIYETGLPGFPRDGYTDDEILASKAAASNAIARAAIH